MASINHSYPLDLDGYTYDLLSCDPSLSPDGTQRKDADGRLVWRVHLRETAPDGAVSYQQEVTLHGARVDLPPLTRVSLMHPVLRAWMLRGDDGRPRTSGVSITVDGVDAAGTALDGGLL